MTPLAGLVVLDFSRVLAAPMATQILAELGATVIKVERPRTGDESRAWEPMLQQGEGARESAYFFAFNRGKQSITLNLKSPAAQQIARDLARGADILVENFLPGDMDRLNLGYETLAAENPRLIYVSNTGFGQDGPYRDRKGYDTIFQALSGVMALTGHADGPPAKVGVPFADLTSGLWITIAVLAALAGRTASGRGSHVDVAMLDAQVSLLTIAAARLFALGEEPRRTGTEHPGRVPSAAFQCRDGGWLHISGSDQHWPAICSVLGLSLDLPRNADRVAGRAAVMAAMTVAIAGRDRGPLAEALRAADVPAGEVNSVSEILSDSHIEARGMVGSFEHPVAGRFPALRLPLAGGGWGAPGDRGATGAGGGYGSRARRGGAGCGGDRGAAGGGGDRMTVRTVVADGVARVILARGEARNALNLAMCHALTAAFEALDADEAVRVVVLSAEGPVFCAGADMKERVGHDEAWVRARRMASFRAYETIERCRKPVIALLGGAAIGSGGEIALCCDFALGTAAASFRFPEPQWGTVGATQRLQRAIGKRRAKELLFTGRSMGAAEALSIGLIARVVDDLEGEAREVAAAIAKAPGLAMALTKQAIDLGEEVALSTGIRIELAAIERNLVEGDWRRGLDQFAGKP